jgi:drug/metabolite transporter (DMT)-like permease
MKNTRNQLTKRPIVFIAALFACFLWGSAFPAVKSGYALLGIESSPWFIKMQFAGFRFLLASLMVGLFLIASGQKIRLTRSEIKPVILLGIMQTSIQYFFFYLGLANTTGIKGAIMTSTGTFFSILIPHFYYTDDKINLNKLIGLIVGFTGVILINIGKGPVDAHFTFTGEGFLIVSSLIGAIAAIVAKENASHIHPVKLNAYQMFFGSLIILATSFIFSGGETIQWTTKSLPIFVYLSFISAAAFSLWFSLLKYNKVSHISIFKFAVPIIGTLLSALILPDESISVYVFISLALTALGIFLVNRDQHSKKVRDS